MQRIGDHGISLGVYLLDPDDNEIEVYYEMPKSEWQWPTDKGLFGGIFPRKLEEPAGRADHEPAPPFVAGLRQEKCRLRGV